VAQARIDAARNEQWDSAGLSLEKRQHLEVLFTLVYTFPRDLYNGGRVPRDQGGIMTRDEWDELVIGVEKWYECVSDNEIRELNEQVSEFRLRRMKSRRTSGAKST